MARKPKANEPKKRELLARGGGNATASGVSFQASVAAYFASQGLAETPLDARLGLGTAKPTGFRFETEAPVDDILIALDTVGWAFIQGKNSLTNSASLASELGKTCDEFARLWEAASTGSGANGWDRPLGARAQSGTHGAAARSAGSDDREYPTRLGRETRTLLLARRSNGGLHPWAEGPDLGPTEAEMLSEVSAAAARLNRLPLPDQAAPEIRAFTAGWPDWKRATVTVCPVDAEGGICEGLRYDPGLGLLFGLRPGRA